MKLLTGRPLKVGWYWDIESVDLRNYVVINKFIKNRYKNVEVTKIMSTSLKNEYRFTQLNKKRGFHNFSSYDGKNAADYTLLGMLHYNRDEHDVIVIVSNDKIFERYLTNLKQHIWQFYTHKCDFKQSSKVEYTKLYKVFKRNK